MAAETKLQRETRLTGNSDLVLGTRNCQDSHAARQWVQPMLQLRTVQRCPRSAIDATLQVLLMPPCRGRGQMGWRETLAGLLVQYLYPESSFVGLHTPSVPILEAMLGQKPNSVLARKVWLGQQSLSNKWIHMSHEQIHTGSGSPCSSHPIKVLVTIEPFAGGWTLVPVSKCWDLTAWRQYKLYKL